MVLTVNEDFTVIVVATGTVLAVVGLELVVEADVEIKVVVDIVTEPVSVRGDAELLTPLFSKEVLSRSHLFHLHLLHRQYYY